MWPPAEIAELSARVGEFITEEHWEVVDARREDRCIHNGDGRYFAEAFAEGREEAQPPLCRWTSVVLGGYGRITGTICPRPHKLRQNSGIFIGRRGSYQGKDMAMQRSTAQLVAAAQAES